MSSVSGPCILQMTYAQSLIGTATMDSNGFAKYKFH